MKDYTSKRKKALALDMQETKKNELDDNQKNSLL
jgi:hypothetical protein